MITSSGTADPEGWRGKRLVRIVAASAVPVFGAYGVQEYLVYRHLAGAVVMAVAAVLMALVAAWLPRIRRETAIHLMCGTFVAAVLCFSFLRGGYQSSVMQWAIILPVGTLILGETVAAMVWTSVFLLGGAGLHIAQSFGIVTPHIIPTPSSAIFSTSLLMIFGLALGRVFQKARLRVEDERNRLRGRLAHASKMESLGRLAGGIAHDFNNLLAVVAARSTLALEDVGAGHPARTHLRAIESASARGAGLVQDLLAFSREQVGQARVLDPDTVVQETMDLLQAILPETIVVETRLSRQRPLVRTDSVRLGQVVVNLCVNARDAMGDGGRLRVRTQIHENKLPEIMRQRELPPGRWWVLSVEDEGGGIDPEIVDRIFDPFFTTKEPGQGVGLGLAMVHGTVEEAGGQLEVRSKAKQGTRIRVFIPLAAPEDVPALPGPPHSHVSPESFVVLYVEDDTEVREATAAMLQRAGFQMIVAGSGPEALDALKNAELEVEVLVTDVQMPQMSGPVLAKRVRELQPEARVVFVSGYAAQDVKASTLAEVDGVFLRKPFSRAELLEAVAEAGEAARSGVSRPVVSAASG